MNGAELAIRQNELTPGGALRGDHLERIRNLILARVPIILPSDTCYSLAVDPTVSGLSQFVNNILDRDREPVSLAFDSIPLIEQWAVLGVGSMRLLEHLTPGPLTLVCQARFEAPTGIVAKSLDAAGHTLGIRIPDSQIERQLVNRLQRPITTVAIRDSAKQPIRDIAQAVERVSQGLKKQPDTERGRFAAVEARTPFDWNTHSTVVQMNSNSRNGSGYEVLRVGSIDEESIRQALAATSQYEFTDWT